MAKNHTHILGNFHPILKWNTSKDLYFPFDLHQNNIFNRYFSNFYEAVPYQIQDCPIWPSVIPISCTIFIRSAKGIPWTMSRLISHHSALKINNKIFDRYFSNFFWCNPLRNPEFPYMGRWDGFFEIYDISMISSKIWIWSWKGIP